MATTMKAAILHGREDIRIEHVPVPEARPGELIVRVGAALTCGTDLKVFRRGYHARMIVPPALFGHELAGTVVEAGDGVDGFCSGRPRGGAEFSAVRTMLLLRAWTRRISATTCSSTTAPMRSSFAFRPGSWPKTR